MDTTSTSAPVLDEIDERVAALREWSAAAGLRVLPPLLALGTSERVGSNWLSDTLRPVMTQHNEPFRQQLGAMHPLSAVNPYPVALEQASPALLGSLGRHALVVAVLAKHAQVRHMVKETNLFFTAPAVLRLFAHSPVVVLTRSPVGVASSFARSGLFARWGYADRYQQMVTMTTGPRAHLAGLVPDDDPDELTALTRLIVLNTVLLADALDEREHTRISYETAVLDRPHAWTALEHLVPYRQPNDDVAPATTGEGLFATNTTKTTLTAHLTPAQAAQVTDATATTLAAAADTMPPQVVRHAADWLAGAEHYTFDAEPPRAAPTSTPPVVRPGGADVEYVHLQRLAWRNLLVTNAEFCGFLNAAHAAGLANTRRGTHLLLVPMPHERGGRVHWSPDQDAWTVSPGYEHHPVYWVTWLGAAAFAAVNSARLPNHAEADALAAGVSTANHDYSHGDVQPAVQGRPWHGIHHAVGNLQIWCGNGPEPRFGQPVERWIHGAAWNTPASTEEIGRHRSRHLLGASRGVGIRLIRDTPTTGPTVTELAALAGAWIDRLDDRDRTLSDLDGEMLRALQTDVRLGAHV